MIQQNEMLWRIGITVSGTRSQRKAGSSVCSGLQSGQLLANLLPILTSSANRSRADAQLGEALCSPGSKGESDRVPAPSYGQKMWRESPPRPSSLGPEVGYPQSALILCRVSRHSFSPELCWMTDLDAGNSCEGATHYIFRNRE